MEKEIIFKVVETMERSRSTVKVLKDENDTTYYAKSFKSDVAEDDPQRDWLKAQVLNDYGSIQFMNQIPELDEYVPRFCEGEKETPSFRMTNVDTNGTGQQLDEILLEGEADLAEKALIGLLKSLATIHKETIGKETAYLKIREGLGKNYEKLGGMDKCLTNYKNFLEKMSKHLSIDFAAHEIEAELKEVLEAVFKPKDLLGLTHWDPCPDNCMLVDDIVKVYDFESASYANVLIDGLYLSIRFPSCWCFSDIPQTVIDKAERAYRKVLSEKVPAIADDNYFMKQKATIMTFWLVQSTYRNLERTFTEDFRWGIATMRQRTLLRLELVTNMLKQQQMLPNILNIFEALGSELSQKWKGQVAAAKMYNAFLSKDEKINLSLLFGN